MIADVALCPMEAVKVRVQTQPGFARGLSDGLPKLVKAEGALGYDFIDYLFSVWSFWFTLTNLSPIFEIYRLYKGLVPLWGRQIPCKKFLLFVLRDSSYKSKYWCMLSVYVYASWYYVWKGSSAPGFSFWWPFHRW